MVGPIVRRRLESHRFRASNSILKGKNTDNQYNENVDALKSENIPALTHICKPGFSVCAMAFVATMKESK